MLKKILQIIIAKAGKDLIDFLIDWTLELVEKEKKKNNVTESQRKDYTAEEIAQINRLLP